MNAMSPMHVPQNYHEQLVSGHALLMLVRPHTLRVIVVDEGNTVLSDVEFGGHDGPRFIEEVIVRLRNL